MHNDEFYEYLLGISVEAAEMYLRYHPKPVQPKDIAEAIIEFPRHNSELETNSRLSYEIVNRFRLSCSRQFRMEDIFRKCM